MATILLLRNFNPYANRTYYRYDKATTYGRYSSDTSYIFNNVNISYNDWINVTVTITGLTGLTTPKDYTYALVNEDDTVTTIVRWDGFQRYFVTSIHFEANGVAIFELRRDVLADYQDYWINCPSIIHRASVIPEAYSYAKYRKDMELSQVKTKEELLRDRTDGRGWIIGYLTKDFVQADSSIGDNGFISVTEEATSYSKVVDDISEYENKRYARNTTNNFWLGVRTAKAPDGVECHQAMLSGYETLFWSPEKEDSGAQIYAGGGWFNNSYSKAYKIDALNFNKINFSTIEVTLEGAMRNLADAILNNYVWSIYEKATDFVLSLKDGEIIYDRATQKAYRVGVDYNMTNVSDAISEELLDQYINSVSFPNKTSDASHSKAVNGFSFDLEIYSFTFTEVTSDADVILRINPNHGKTNDSAYDVFAVPLGGTIDVISQSDPTQSTSLTIDDAYVMDIVNKIISQWKVSTDDSTGLIDIQWLPYGPDQIFGTLTEAHEGVMWKGNTPVGIMTWLTSCQLSKTLTGVGTIEVPSANLDARILNETTSWRLCSPNQASMFDFSAVKNGGVTGYTIDIAYKPFTPYICVAPIFGGLYGGNYHDGRGLILSGEFSLDQVSNAWNQYKFNNKNYELIFNRQIATMDVESTYAMRTANQQRVTDAMSTITGSLKGVAGGALTGMKLSGGNPYAGIAGAVIGGGTALASGIVNSVYDAENAKTESQIRAVDRQNAIAQYQYQISNIKARGDTITKISTFNPDNKIYPVLETYTCTYQEQSQLTESVKWNGFGLEMFGSISDFGTNGAYISATPLRFATAYYTNATAPDDRDLLPPLNILNEIVKELELGIYLYGDTDPRELDEEEST